MVIGDSGRAEAKAPDMDEATPVKDAVKRRLLVIRWWMRHLDGRQLRVWLYRFTRPASYPYISGDGFRRMAKHVYDETNLHVSVDKVREGDIIFVSTEYAHRFFMEVDPKIRASYRLITHNSDVPVGESLASLAGDRVQVWFARNNTYRHAKIVPIPIGLENLFNYNVGIPRDYTEFRTHPRPRRPRILSGFTLATNPAERRKAFEIAGEAPCVDQLPERRSQREYLQTLITYKFVLSPPGNGLDTNRTWEALYLGAVPIVKDSVAMRSFKGRGLPLWIVQDWEELATIQQEDLEEKYEELRAGFQAPALFMQYWRELIRGSVSAGMLRFPESRSEGAEQKDGST